MKTNWVIIGIVLFFAILGVVFMMWRNAKDRKELERYLEEEEWTNKDDEPNDQE
ncbi:hypothetical protein [Flavobacterium silvisoli]|uniref:hypothetical protein n=1 Tax=Flavobacterium silvisoli TaxID=2529433 RepID=UPI0012B5BE00|nr:hypothetical protein [Flavobacterium silvisoli]